MVEGSDAAMQASFHRRRRRHRLRLALAVEKGRRVDAVHRVDVGFRQFVTVGAVASGAPVMVNHHVEELTNSTHDRRGWAAAAGGWKLKERGSIYVRLFGLLIFYRSSAVQLCGWPRIDGIHRRLLVHVTCVSVQNINSILHMVGSNSGDLHTRIDLAQ